MDDDTLILDYECDRGAAKIYAIAEQNEVWFYVFLLQAQDDGCIITETPFTSFLAANMLFLDFVDWANNKRTKEPFWPCSRREGFIRSCNPANCIEGNCEDHSFWPMFHNQCKYRRFRKTVIDVVKLNTR